MFDGNGFGHQPSIAVLARAGGLLAERGGRAPDTGARAPRQPPRPPRPRPGAPKGTRKGRLLRAIVLAGLALSTFAYVTAESLPIGLLPPMARDLGVSPSAIGLLVTAYGLVVVVSSIPLTRWSRRVGRRPLLSALLGILVLATLGAAAAPGYGLLLGARVATALSQALFWSVVVATAAGLYPAHVRGRVVAIVFGGSALSPVLGLPAATWLGQQAGWRTAFVALAGVGLLALLPVAALLRAEGETAPPARGTSPDPARFRVTVVVTAVAVTGAFISFTYVSPFLEEVSGLGPAALGPALLARGLAGLAGVFASGALVDRWPRAALVAPVGLQTAALLGLFAAGDGAIAGVVWTALAGFSLSALATALATRVLQHAPGDVNVASATVSTAFNVGITAGALVGAALVAGPGLPSTAVAGGALSALALSVAVLEPRLAARSGSTTRWQGRASDGGVRLPT